ncbi:MAG: hypothetical protein WBI29_02890 [Candidatus Saccharimonadales bacterium]
MTDFSIPNGLNVNTTQPQPVNNPSNSNTNNSRNKSTVVIIVLSILLVLLSVLSIWMFVSYSEQKKDVDGKIASAITDAKKQQADKLEADFIEREKSPSLEFNGPEDYGSLSFMYPKTWSVYIENDGSSGGDYVAYFNPRFVPSVKNKSQLFALRVYIEPNNYEDVVDSYGSRVKDGDLKSSSITVNNIKGIRLDGNFSEDIRGSAVIFKMRDKTLTIRSDANIFRTDFDRLIKTIKFNQ